MWIKNNYLKSKLFIKDYYHIYYPFARVGYDTNSIFKVFKEMTDV